MDTNIVVVPPQHTFPYVRTYVSEAESQDARRGMRKDQVDEWKFSDYVTDDIQVMMHRDSRSNSEYATWQDDTSSSPSVRAHLHKIAGMPYTLQSNIVALVIKKYQPSSILDPDMGLGETLLGGTLGKDLVVGGLRYTGIRSPTKAPQMRYFYDQIVRMYAEETRFTILDNIDEVKSANGFAMGFVSLSCAEVCSDDVILKILNCWSKIKQGGVLCVYVSPDIDERDGEINVVQAISTLPGILAYEREFGCIHTWTKELQFAASLPTTRTITFVPTTKTRRNPSTNPGGGVFDLQGMSTTLRTLQLYLVSLPEYLYYVCDGYDKIAVDLATACVGTGKYLTIYISFGEGSTSFTQELRVANPQCSVSVYSGPYTKQRDAVRIERQDALLDPWLDNAGFRAVMHKMLDEDLPSTLPSPRGILLRVYSPAVLRVLLEKWPETTFSCVVGNKQILQNIPTRYQHRLIVYTTKNPPSSKNLDVYSDYIA